MARIDELLASLKESGGSDLHLIAGGEPRMRIKGALEPIPGEAALDDASLRGLMGEIVSAEQWADFDACGDLDFAHGLPGVTQMLRPQVKRPVVAAIGQQQVNPEFIGGWRLDVDFCLSFWESDQRAACSQGQDGQRQGQEF